MNKLFIAFFFIFAISSANAGGFSSFLDKLSKGLDKVSTTATEITDKVGQVATAADKTLSIASNIVDSIVTDLKTVSDDVKALGKTIETEFNSLYTDAMKIVEKTKTFAEMGYKDGAKLYTDLNKQLTSLIASAQADVDRAISAAKTTVAKLSSDVRIVYSNGKLVAQQITDSADLSTAIANVKSQNKEALNNTIEEINAALAEANAIIAKANESLKTYQELATKYSSDVKTGANKIVAQMQVYIEAAKKQLETFKVNQEKTLKGILEDAQALYSSSKTVLEQATTTLDKAVDLYNKNSDAVKGASSEIESVWKNKSSSSSTTVTNTNIKQITDAISQATTTVQSLTDEGKKVTTALTSAETALTDVTKTVSSEISAIQFKITASKLNVRSLPSTSGKVVKVLSKNDIVTVTGQSGTWSQIAADQWVSTKYLALADKTAAKESATKIQTTITNTLNSLKSLFSAIGK